MSPRPLTAHASTTWSAMSWWLKALVVLAVCYSVLHLGYSIVHYTIFSADMYRSRDFARVFLEAKAWRDTGLLPSFEGILYPPLYYVLVLPLTHLDFRMVTYLLYGAQFLYFPIAVCVLVNAVSPARAPSAIEYVIAAVLTVNFQPFLETLAQHKVEGIEFLLICLALSALRRRHDLLAGSLIGLAASLKYLPAVLAGYFVVKREWKVVQGLLITLLVCVLVLLPFYGVGNLWLYGVWYPLLFFFGHTYAGTGPQANLEWQNLSGAINRWFAGWDTMVVHFDTEGNMPIAHPQLALGIAAILKGLLGGGYLFLIRRPLNSFNRQTQWAVSLLELSLTLLLISVFASATRMHYAILLLPAFVSTALLLFQHPQHFHGTEKWLCVLAYSLTAMVIPGGLLNQLPPHPLWGAQHSYFYLWMSFPFYGHVLLGGCLVLCHRRLVRGPGLPDHVGR